MRTILLSLLLTLNISALYAQHDSLNQATRHNRTGWRIAIPSAMVAYGIAAKYWQPLKQADINIYNSTPSNAHTYGKIGDYTQYTPIAATFALKLCGVESRHSLRDITLVSATSYMLTAVSVESTKRLSDVERPDGSDNHSFPSGHSAIAFTGAHILCREYWHTSPLIGIAGYGVAAFTAYSRVAAGEHWMSDVVAGAGFGILCAEAGYALLPVWNKLLGLDKTHTAMAITPVASLGTYGLGLTCVF